MCHALPGGELSCRAQLWIHDRWRGRFGSVYARLALPGAAEIRWSGSPELEVGADPVTRGVQFRLPADTRQVVTAEGQSWTLWHPTLPTTICTAATISADVILAQPLETQLKAVGWRFGARRATGRPGVDFAAAHPTAELLRTVLEGAASCQGADSLHIPPQLTDPYVRVISPGAQILLALPLATIP